MLELCFPSKGVIELKNKATSGKNTQCNSCFWSVTTQRCVCLHGCVFCTVHVSTSQQRSMAASFALMGRTLSLESDYFKMLMLQAEGISSKNSDV